MRTQVVVIGGGPAGLLLSQLLQRQGIETVLLERQSRAYVLARIRAGVIETGAVELLREAGVGERMDREGLKHEGIFLATDNRDFRIDFKRLCGGTVLVYGQTELTFDLYQARDEMGATMFHEVDAVRIDEADGDSPRVSFTHEGRELGSSGIGRGEHGGDGGPERAADVASPGAGRSVVLA